MRLFNYFAIGLLLLSSSHSYAQYAYAGAYAGANAGAGTGYWGGAQACPYPVNAIRGNSVEKLEGDMESIEEEIANLEAERDAILYGTDDMYSLEELPLDPLTREGLGDIVSGSQIPCVSTYSNLESEAVKATSEAQKKLIHSLFTKSTMDKYCSKSANPVISASLACNVEGIYTEGAKVTVAEKKACTSFLKQIKHIEDNLAAQRKELEKTREQIREARIKEREAERRARLTGSSATEACVDCQVVRPEPTMPSGVAMTIAGVTDFLRAGAGLWMGKYGIDKCTAAGKVSGKWECVPPIVPNMIYPHATMGLFQANGYFGGGMGSGSWGCAPGAGYQYGPGGVYGSPFGNVSPYGACGGAFASPCSGYGYPSFGQQYGPGAYGPFAGYPNFGAYAGVGAGFGGPGGYGGYPYGGGGYGPYMNPYMGAAGPFGQFGGNAIGNPFGTFGGNAIGNPFGIFGGNGYNPMYAQAQALALQNQQALIMQIGNLDQQVSQLSMSRMYLIQQLGASGYNPYGGFSVGAGINFNFGLGGGYSGGYYPGSGQQTILPYPGIPGSGGGTPAR